jgi:soluble lytic murein transglycosylase-like protein
MGVRSPAAAALAVALALACAPGAASGAGSGFPAMPQAAGARGVEWRVEGGGAGRAASADSAAGAAARDSALRAALARAGPNAAGAIARAIASMRLAAGDSAAAESLLALPRGAGSVFGSALISDRAGLALARRGPGAADSLLGGADRAGWSDVENAAWLERRSALALARGDTARSSADARRVVRAYPSLAPAARALARLEAVAAARAETLSLEEQKLAAEVDAFRGAAPAGGERLLAALQRRPAGERFPLALRAAEMLRAGRRPLASAQAAALAASLAPDAAARARALLERARGVRDAGVSDSALALFARAASTSADPAVRAAAWWEYAREAQDRSRWREAAAGFSRVAESSDRRADEARFQAGLARWLQGDVEAARAWWRRAGGENARFWLALSLRQSGAPAGDSLLATLAKKPGYGWYRAVARESLGWRGWNRAIAPEACADSAACAALAEARVLVALGLADDARTLLERWAAADPRALRAGVRLPPEALLAGARVAYGAGAGAVGSRLAERAFSDAAAAGDSLAWAVVPWAYPPAFAAQVAACETLGVERALLWALVRQESRFDPRARSRSDALGLTQLKRATAGDAARSLREAAPSESTLFEPGPSLRYGARYLATLARRYDGDVAVALSAYNAGPTGIRSDWRALLARGGDALFAELASNADSQDYVRRVLGFRQAYRELAPSLSP